MYRGFQTNLVELKIAIRLTMTAVDGDMLDSAVISLVTRLTSIFFLVVVAMFNICYDKMKCYCVMLL